MKGNLVGWTLPTTLNRMTLYGITGLTGLPLNYTGCTNFTSIYVYYSPMLAQNINDFHFDDNLRTIQFQGTSISGNVETFIMPTGCTQLEIRESKLTGNVSLMPLSNTLVNLNFSNNYLTGELTDMTIPNSLNSLYLGGSTNKITATFSSGNPFHTKNIYNELYLDYMTGATGIGISGDLSYLIFDNNLNNLNFQGSSMNCDLSKLNPAKIYSLWASYCSTGLTGNLTNWLTGTTIFRTLYLNNSPNLSGNTTNWNVNGINDLRINSTNLSGALKHNNVYILYGYYTQISSNISGFSFTNQGYDFNMNNCNLVGNLSSVTLKYSMYGFHVGGNANLYGSNEFVNYLFVNRKNFTSYYLFIDIFALGDSVTGTSETLGSLGTWGGSQWDLSEAEVNNLVDGLDYNGSGSNTPWDSKNKIYWMKNAQISSVNPSRRYIYFQITY